MKPDIIDRLVRPANPVPDPQLLGADVVSIEHKRERKEMQQQLETDRGSERSGTGRGPWIGIAAAVALVVGGFVVFQATQSDDVATATPLEIASEYLEAYANFDVEGVESMLSEDAVVVPWESFAGRDDWQADLRYLDAAGFELIIGECQELPELAEGSRVNCDYEAHGLGSDRIGLEPFGGHQFRLVIEDGKVVSSDMGFDFTDFSGTMWFPFVEWIQENHSADYPVMYEDDSLSKQTDAAIALWQQRVEDYVAFVNGQ